MPLSPSGGKTVTWLQESLAGHTLDNVNLGLCAFGLQETIRVLGSPSPPDIELGGLAQPGKLLRQLYGAPYSAPPSVLEPEEAGVICPCFTEEETPGSQIMGTEA